jgi:hypothetical protein
LLTRTDIVLASSSITQRRATHSARARFSANFEPFASVARVLVAALSWPFYESFTVALWPGRLDVALRILEYHRRMDSNALARMAELVLEKVLRATEGTLDVRRALELQADIELALLTAARSGRSECAAQCTARAELWERTERDAPAGEPRLEARHRANEARYLADLLSTRTSEKAAHRQ